MPEVDEQNCKYNPFFASSLYLIFTFIWIIIILWNKFYKSNAFMVLIIPIFIFTIGFCNTEECDDNVQRDIFKVSFISVGLLLSLPLLKLFNEKNEDRMLNHVVFLAMIFVLLSYYHIWVSQSQRQYCKIIQSCLETYSITLYIFALVIFFLQ